MITLELNNYIMNFIQTFSLTWLFLLVFWTRFSFLEIVPFEGTKLAYGYCSGVYSKQDVLGSSIPSVSLHLDNSSVGKLSFLIFNILDAESLKIHLIQNIVGRSLLIFYVYLVVSYIDGLFCNSEQFHKGLCSPEGSLLNTPSTSPSAYLTKSYQLDGLTPVNETFVVNESGYYCIIINSIDPSSAASLKGLLIFKNPFGYLAARKYPPMILNVILASAYLLIGMVWTYYTFKYRKEIIQVQNYISLLFFVLMLEAFATFIYYLNNNLTGSNSNFLFFIFLALTSLRASLSLFLMLIVAMGYGIYKPNLESSVLRRILLLSGCHYTFGLLTSSASLYGKSNSVATGGAVGELSDFSIICFLLPFLVSTLIFYYWTGTSLKTTLALLTSKQQHYKLALYASFTRILNICFIIVFGMIFLSALVLLSHRSDLIWRGNHWSSVWFWLEGWPSLLYFAGFISVTYLLRPRKDNRRYGLEQLPSSDDIPHDDDPSLLGNTGYPLQSIKVMGSSLTGPNSPNAYYQKAQVDEDDEWTEQHIGYVSKDS